MLSYVTYLLVGPMSVSVYVKEKVVDKYRHTLAEAFVNRTNVAIHLVINTNVRHVAAAYGNTIESQLYIQGVV